MLGDRRFDDNLADPSEEAHQAFRQRQQAWLDRASAMDSSALGASDAIALAMFVGELESQLASEVCGYRFWSFSPRGNPLSDVGNLPREHNPQNAEQAGL